MPIDATGPAPAAPALPFMSPPLGRPASPPPPALDGSPTVPPSFCVAPTLVAPTPSPAAAESLPPSPAAALDGGLPAPSSPPQPYAHDNATPKTIRARIAIQSNARARLGASVRSATHDASRQLATRALGAQT